MASVENFLTIIHNVIDKAQECLLEAYTAQIKDEEISSDDKFHRQKLVDLSTEYVKNLEKLLAKQSTDPRHVKFLTDKITSLENTLENERKRRKIEDESSKTVPDNVVAPISTSSAFGSTTLQTSGFVYNRDRGGFVPSQTTGFISNANRGFGETTTGGFGSNSSGFK